MRNSGVEAVVEGVGDHGCEYMTGGRVVVLGATGRNFAAGMSGGVAYVLDEDGTFAKRCNMGMVGFEELDEADAIELRAMVGEHLQRTESPVAARVLERFDELLADWETALTRFTEVIPRDFRIVMDAKAKAEADGLDENETATAMMDALHG